MKAATYSVYWFDDELQQWHCHRDRVRKWTLRRVLRGLYANGWSRMSVLVVRRNLRVHVNRLAEVQRELFA